MPELSLSLSLSQKRDWVNEWNCEKQVYLGVENKHIGMEMERAG